MSWYRMDEYWWMMDGCYSPVWWIQKEEEQNLCLRSLLIYTQHRSRIGVRKKKVFFPSLVLNCATIHDKRESQLSDNVLDYAIGCIVLSLWDDHISERHYGKLEQRILRGLGSSWAVSKNLWDLGYHIDDVGISFTLATSLLLHTITCILFLHANQPLVYHNV